MVNVASFNFSVPITGFRYDGYLDVIVYGERYSTSFKVTQCTIAYRPDPYYQEHSDEAFPYSCTLTFGNDYTLGWSGLDRESKYQIWSKRSTPSWANSATFPYGTTIRCYFSTIRMGQLIESTSDWEVVRYSCECIIA